jgi:PAS domain S-box-containing protein
MSRAPEAGAAELAARLVDHSLDGMFAVDRHLRLTAWNPAMERLSGLAGSEVLGRAVLEACPFLSEIGEDVHLRAALEGQSVTARDRPFTVPEAGRSGFFEGRYLPLHDAAGEVTGAIGIIRDVTEQTKAAQVLQESENRFRTMADCAPVLLWMSGNDGLCTWFNKPWLDFTGRTLEQELGNGWAEGVHFEDLQACLDGYFEAFGARRPFTLQYRLRRHDGEYRHIHDQGAPRYSADGAFAGYIGSCIDITEYQVAQEALQKLADELEDRVEERTGALTRSNAALQEFAHTVSHDLQEPLRMVTSYLQLLAKRYQGRLDQDADEFIGYATDGARRMHELVQSLLDFSRVTIRAEPLRPTDAASALADALGNLEVAIAEAGGVVTFDNDSLPRVSADPVQLTEVFQNLVGNALKFRGEEAPLVRVTAVREGGAWRLSVADNGIGIDPEHFERIFEIFQRLHARGDYPGTGLGLALCKRIVERHGGRIWVESQPGRGSTFHFTLKACHDDDDV